MPDDALGAAAVLLVLTGSGFGIPGLVGIRSLAEGHGIATVLGFPTYGEGPFERHGIQSTVPLLLAFLAVCLLEILAGVLVWQGSRLGAILALVSVVPGAFFWWGFALPIPPFVAMGWSALIYVGWGQLG